MVPFEAALKQSSGGMIWPPGKTSIRKRPALISSTSFASRSAKPCMEEPLVQVVDIRHWTFCWAMTWGASVMAAAAATATAPPAFAMNLRRSVIPFSSTRFEGSQDPALFNHLIGPPEQQGRNR